MPEPDVILPPEATPYRFGLEPALNAINSLLLLSRSDRWSGLGEWIVQTANSLTPQQFHTNRLVVEGLHHAMLPVQSWTSFPAYLQNLATLPGTLLRERLLDAYLDIAREPKMACAPGEEIQIPTREALIASVDVYLDFLDRAFGDFDRDLEAEAHALIQHPDTMKRVIVEHLGFMWEQHLAAEWTRTLPLLQESIDAFRQVRLDGLDKLEAIRTVTGQDTPDEKWRWIADLERIVFVPSAHVGPYLGKLHLKSDPGQLYLIYGARLPEGIRAARPASALSRAELVVRFSALADDTRLRILALLGEQGELCAQDIITALDLSQSAASRHLTQLSATGYLIERRQENAKCYRLNPERITATLDALQRFLHLP